MTFLPIVERELRVAARRRGTYWTRLGIALLATGVGTATFTITLGSVSPQQTGKFIFQGLSGLLMLYCLAYGRRATADCLSLEKREGTLGLLFLTDLKGHDVVLGKLVATSLGGFYGLLAVLPVLSVCLLLGGITSGEFWRMALVLVDTFLLSLGIGMLGSALTRDFRRAMAANFLLLLLVIAVPPACASAFAYFAPSHRLIPELLFSCPPYAFYLSFDAAYGIERVHYWQAVGVIHGLTWLLVLAASWVVPLSWQDQPTRSSRNRWRELWQAWNFGEPARRPAYRRQLLDVNAFYWLAARVRLKPVHVWTFLGLLAAWWVVGWLTSGKMWLDEVEFVLTALMLNFTFKVWVAIEAGQELADDQRSGAVELLLSVPLTVGEILRGQVLALRRQFLKPLLFVIGVELVFLWVLHRRSPIAQTLVPWLAVLVVLVADLVALVGVGMMRALTSKNHNHATIGTLVRVLVVPWALFGIVVGVINLWSALTVTGGPQWSPGWKFYVGLWFGFSLAADLVYGLSAWWQLRTRFRKIALRRFNPTASRFGRWVSDRRSRDSLPRLLNSVGVRAGGETIRERRTADTGATVEAHGRGPLRSRWSGQRGWRKPAAVVAAGLLVVCSARLWLRPHPSFPPPVAVAVTQNKGPLRVFPGVGGVFLILPDGSLWRWGEAGGSQLPRAAVPERVGTSSDWVEVAPAGRHCAGLRADGTIWEWGSRGGRLSTEPERVEAGNDWVGIAASLGHSVALRKDGTLWAWGQNTVNQLGNGPGPSQTNLVQVGTNNDWSAVCGYWSSTFAIRTDGTLWVWGAVWFRGSSGTRSAMKNFATPTRVCAETNWIAFTPSSSPLVRNRSGELWDPTFAAADPDAPAASSCRLVATNSAANRTAVAMAGKPMLYEVRPDGTLWEKDYAGGLRTAAPDEKWRRVGKRSDWVSLWGGGGTAMGVTADETVWTWGLDPGREPAFDFSNKLKVAQMRLRAWFGARSPMISAGATPPYVKEPWELMRLVPAGAKQ
ncbi:MAG TPA: hypothetical protein VNZ64_28060 [Candidatus Acidoferrum sp.]|jgi:ABC-type transport system involved in multi-copper enzyme maturation permease subunit|nr:hypothetical protein [Candidatus Acidoferrum sp.]